MKRVLSYITVLFIGSFIYITPAFADSFEFIAQVDNTEVVVGSEVTVNVLIKSNTTGDGLSGCSFRTALSDGIEFMDVKGANNWQITISSNNVYLLADSSEVGLTQSNSGDGKKIVEFKYKVNSAATLTFSGIQCTEVNLGSQDGDFDLTHEDVTVNFTTKEVAQDNTLKSLEVTNGTMLSEDGFVPTEKYYIFKVTSSTFAINAVTSNTEFQNSIKVTSIDGTVLDPSNITYSSNQESMPIYIVVNNAQNEKYTLMIQYEPEEEKTLDNTLKSLTVGGKTVDLSKCSNEGNVYSCEVTLDKGVDTFKVDAILNDSDNFEIDQNDGGIGNYSFIGNANENDILLVVKPKDLSLGVGELRYIVTVKKPVDSGTTPGTQTKPGNQNNNKVEDKVTNPQTGSISSFVMAIVLISSLVASIILYTKNMESYR